MLLDIQCYLVYFHAYAYITIKSDFPASKLLSINFSPSIPSLSDMTYKTRKGENSWNLKYGSRYVTIDRENSGAFSDVRGTLSWSSRNSECMYSPTPQLRLYGNGSCYKNDDIGVSLPIGIVADTQFRRPFVSALFSDLSYIYKSRYNIEMQVGSFFVKSDTEICQDDIRSTLENFDRTVINGVTNGSISELKRNVAWILLAECDFESTGTAYFGSVSRTAISRKSAVVNSRKEDIFHSLYKQVANLMSNDECNLLRRNFY
jgi:hypothetical protein